VICAKRKECNTVVRHQQGFSLVELLVAFGIGLVIVASLSQLFVDISRTNEEMAKTNSQIENARFSIQILESDIVHAGFWDTHVPQFDNLSFVDIPADVPSAIPDPCLAYSPANWTAEFKYQLVGVPVQVASGDPGSCGTLIADRVTGTDVLVVRHAHTCAPGTTDCDDPNTPGQLNFQASVCEDDAKLFELDPNSPLTDKKCTPGTQAPRRKFVQSIYYIREWFSDTPSKDGIPTLVRSQFELSGGTLAQQPAQALVEGIEGFRVELGLDKFSEPYTGFANGTAVDPNEAVNWLNPDNWITATNRGDGIPEGDFVHCPTASCTVSDLLSAVSARVYVLARANLPSQGYKDTKTYTLGSATAVGPFNDQYKRHVFSTTIRLNNISGRRETQ
jgi:type IV pilus assembly protein PilW